MTYQSYVISLRIEKAKQLLWKDQYKIYEIAELTDYNDTAYFEKYNYTVLIFSWNFCL